MGKSAEIYDMTLTGIAEVGAMAEFWAGGRFPLIEGINSLPFKYSGLDQVELVDRTLYERGLLQELEPFKLLYFAPVAEINLFTKTKVTKMEDLAGLKLRVSGTNKQTVELLGAIGISMPGEEEYMALERGTLDGNATGADNAVARKLYEVINYGLTTPISMGGFLVIMNKDFWNSCPADIQNAIDQASIEARNFHLVNGILDICR